MCNNQRKLNPIIGQISMETVLSIFLKDIIAILDICFIYCHLTTIDGLEKQPKTRFCVQTS